MLSWAELCFHSTTLLDVWFKGQRSVTGALSWSFAPSLLPVYGCADCLCFKCLLTGTRTPSGTLQSWGRCLMRTWLNASPPWERRTWLSKVLLSILTHAVWPLSSPYAHMSCLVLFQTLPGSFTLVIWGACYSHKWEYVEVEGSTRLVCHSEMLCSGRRLIQYSSVGLTSAQWTLSYT